MGMGMGGVMAWLTAIFWMFRSPEDQQIRNPEGGGGGGIVTILYFCCCLGRLLLYRGRRLSSVALLCDTLGVWSRAAVEASRGEHKQPQTKPPPRWRNLPSLYLTIICWFMGRRGKDGTTGGQRSGPAHCRQVRRKERWERPAPGTDPILLPEGIFHVEQHQIQRAAVGLQDLGDKPGLSMLSDC